MNAAHFPAHRAHPLQLAYYGPFYYTRFSRPFRLSVWRCHIRRVWFVLATSGASAASGSFNPVAGLLPSYLSPWRFPLLPVFFFFLPLCYSVSSAATPPCFSSPSSLSPLPACALTNTQFLFCSASTHIECRGCTDSHRSSGKSRQRLSS
ncbi:hypothetical protein K438DRAFT_969758 [Mycena galopus ATCC 62051]|nr:hypothetical protein K438DRAFT_969758 [Mycena galopus ATCC 62051]